MAPDGGEGGGAPPAAAVSEGGSPSDQVEGVEGGVSRRRRQGAGEAQGSCQIRKAPGSVVQDHGRCGSSCGYCGGEGECSVSHGMWAYKLAAADYQVRREEAAMRVRLPAQRVPRHAARALQRAPARCRGRLGPAGGGAFLNAHRVRLF